MIHCSRMNTISKAIMLICIILFCVFAKPELYVCKHIQFIPDSSSTQLKNSIVVDTVTSYLSELFAIDTSSTVDENILLQHHLGYKAAQCVRLPQLTHCSAMYFLCITAKMTTEFRTEDKRYFIPVPMPGGGMIVNDIKIKDEQPEYHFSTELTFAFYRTSDGKRVLSWKDQDNSEDDSADCSDCISQTISGISGNIYRNLNSQNPVAIFIGSTIGVVTLFDWYNLNYSEDLIFGSSIGFSGKILFRNIFGIDAAFTHHSISSKKYTSNELYAGPCFGYKIYTTNRYFNFLYPNGSLGVTTFWNTRNKPDEIDSVKGALPVIGAFSGKVSALFCLKPFPLSFEPNVKMIIRPTSDDVIVGYDIGVRIGITRDFKKIN